MKYASTFKATKPKGGNTVKNVDPNHDPLMSRWDSVVGHMADSNMHSGNMNGTMSAVAVSKGHFRTSRWAGLLSVPVPGPSRQQLQPVLSTS